MFTSKCGVFQNMSDKTMYSLNIEDNKKFVSPWMTFDVRPIQMGRTH